MFRPTPIALLAGAACTLAFVAGCGHAPAPVAASVQTQAAHAQASTPPTASASRGYPVEDLLGVGPSYGAKLRKEGIKDTNDLLDATETTYKRHKLADATGIPYPIVLRLSQSVELMKIDGVGVRQANLLQAVGIESVAELARRDPQNLADRLGEANAFLPHFVEHAPSTLVVAGWIGEAFVLATAPPPPAGADDR